MVNGISDSLIASILYATGKKLYWKFRDPLKSAIDNTIVYFSKERGMELDRNRFEALLRGDIGEEEHNKFKSGEKFIDGQKLALQFAIFSGFYHDDENQILTISNEIFSYFKTAFTNELLRNPNESIINLNNILEIQFKISQTELDRLRKEVERFQKFLMEKEQLRIKYADFKISNSDFWETIKQQSEEDRLFLYYTNTDSSPVRLKDVVANDFYVINDKIDYQFFTILEECLKNQYSLIKIISRGGEGKSTYLYHIAKRCCSEYNVIILENFNKEILIDIESQLQFDESPKPFLFLLDNPSLFEDELIQSTPKLISAFRKYGLVIIIAEREFRYENFEDKIEFENNFNQVYEINYVAQNLKERIFNKLFSLFQINYDVPEYLRNDAKRIYFQDKRKSLSESTFAVIKEIVKRTGIKFIFDWVDWEKYTKEREPRLNELYLIIATFYQFGFSLPIDFCIKFLKDVNRRTIIKLISESYNHPIYMRRDHLFLRHETIATWYLNDSDNIKRMSLDLFDEFLNKIETEFDKDLVIWIYKHKEFQKSHLSKILDDERQISLLEKYIEKNNCELKCRTELSKIYQKQNRWNEAQDVLLDLLSIDPKNLHARTELAKIYQHKGKYDEAEKVLMECIEIKPDDLNSRTELAKIYQQQGKIEEAETELKDLINLEPKSLHARTELAKIYQQQGKIEEAETELKDLLNLDPKSLHARTELAKIFQHQGKYDKAENILMDLIGLDKNNLHARTELAKIYQHQCKYDEAEKILWECLEININDLNSRTELAKIYQQQGKYDEAEKHLRECLEINKNDLNSRTELAKIYQQQGKIEEAETELKDLLNLEPKSLHARTELAKIFQQQGKYDKAENILMESLAIDEKQLHPRTELAKIYQHQGKYDEAEKILMDLLSLDKNDLQARTELAKIYQHQGKYDKAEKILMESLAIDKKQLHPRTELAKIYQHKGKYDKAEKILMDLLSLDKNDLHARTELAKIYQHKGKYDEAEKILLEILSINSMNCYAMAELVHVYTKNQNPEKCFQVFDEFLKNCRLDKKRRREPQAMFHYIFKLCLQFRRHDKARQYFEKYSHFLDDRNKTLFHQFFG